MRKLPFIVKFIICFIVGEILGLFLIWLVVTNAMIFVNGPVAIWDDSMRLGFILLVVFLGCTFMAFSSMVFVYTKEIEKAILGDKP